MSNNGKLLIPGKEMIPFDQNRESIPMEGFSISVEGFSIPVLVASDISFGKTKENTALSPVATAYSFGGGILIEYLIFVDSGEKIDPKKIKCHYDIKLDLAASYQIILYISFEDEDSSNPYTGMLNLFSGGAFFSANELKINEKTVPIDKVKSVQVILVKNDPETSRGTVTTVQSGDD